MRAISLWQPWATAWVLGIKMIEIRHWATSYRGPLAVHAAQKLLRAERLWWDKLAASDPRFPVEPPRGAIIGIVELVDVVPTERLLDPEVGRISEEEESWGNYGPERFGWVAAMHRPLPEPIRFRGHQSFFSVPADILPAWTRA